MKSTLVAFLYSLCIFTTTNVYSGEVNESDIEIKQYTNREWQLQPNNYYDSPYNVTLFDANNDKNKQRLWSQTKSIFGYGLGVVGFIALLPEDVSNWDKDGKVLSKWGG